LPDLSGFIVKSEMSKSLGTVADLPPDYYASLLRHNLLPLWPSLRAVLPYGRPARKTRPVMWRYADVRPNLLRAGELTPIEKAERRVLVLCNPGFGLENMQATPSIYIGMQLILPNEVAPPHRHTPSAIRLVIEGEGAYTVVSGEKLQMERGDLILTPPGLWHEHGHAGQDPVIWLDALDLPLIYGLDISHAQEGVGQRITDAHNSSATRYSQGGIVPYASLDSRRTRFPLLRYPWRSVKRSLLDLEPITPVGEPIHVAYTNPQSGGECLASMGFSALMLRPGETVKMRRRSSSAVFHGVEGGGTALVDEESMSFDVADTFAVPTYAQVQIENKSTTEPAFLFVIDDAPLQRKLGLYKVLDDDSDLQGAGW